MTIKVANTDGDLYVVKGSKSGMMVIGPGKSTSPKLYSKNSASRTARNINKARTASDIKMHGEWEACPINFTVLPSPVKLRPSFVKV